MPPTLRISRPWIACALFMTAVFVHATGNEPSTQARAGGIQVSDADLRRTIDLTGEWELYWGKLLEPRDFDAGFQESSAGRWLIRVPGSWNDLANGFPGAGSATYHIRVTLPDHTMEPLGLYLRNIATAYRLY